MKRRSFVQLLCVGIMMASTATPTEAITAPTPFSALGRDAVIMPEPAVATSQDMDRAKVEKAWYGHWRRVNRRVYRRHYYYHHPYHYYRRPYYY